MVKLYNTLTRNIQELVPETPGQVSIYTCGPTVYGFAHIGNFRTYIFADTLKRSLIYLDYKVNHGMNITDVGHLVGDGDDGDDKLEVGAAREGKHPLEVAKFYEAAFLSDLDVLNIIRPQTIVRATETVPEQIAIIQELEKRGYIYKDEFAIYFDTSKLPDYGKLSGQQMDEKKAGARDKVVLDSGKKQQQDFALWFFLKGRYQNHVLRWDSPWGPGFPGWHIECSAISRKILGQPFDIHTGGVDHIGTHHTNEIAQSEAAFDIALANLWMHGEFLLVDSSRMGKSEGNLLTVQSLIEKQLHPLDYRYFCLTAHYRTQLNFTWESVLAAQKAFARLCAFVQSIPASQSPIPAYKKKFKSAISDDLNTPQAIAVIWEMIADNAYSDSDKIASILEFDKVLGLNLTDPAHILVSYNESSPEEILPDEIKDLFLARKQAKLKKEYAESDRIRNLLVEKNWEVNDTPEGQQINQIITKSAR